MHRRPFSFPSGAFLPTASAASVSATAMATATAAAATLLGFVDADVASVNFGFVQSVDGSIGAFIVHFNETETAGAARVTIQDYFG